MQENSKAVLAVTSAFSNNMEAFMPLFCNPSCTHIPRRPWIALSSLRYQLFNLSLSSTPWQSRWITNKLINATDTSCGTCWSVPTFLDIGGSLTCTAWGKRASWMRESVSTLKASTVVSVIQNKRGLLTVRLVCVCSETDPILFSPPSSFHPYCSFPQLIWTLHVVSSIILEFDDFRFYIDICFCQKSHRLFWACKVQACCCKRQFSQ